MSWSKSWFMEQNSGGTWFRDNRPWLPVDSPIDLYFFGDPIPSTTGLSAYVDRLITDRCELGFPYDASPEVRSCCEAFYLNQASELAVLPVFGHVRLSDVLSINWAEATTSNAKCNALKAWMQHLKQLDNGSEYRLIYMLWR